MITEKTPLKWPQLWILIEKTLQQNQSRLLQLDHGIQLLTLEEVVVVVEAAVVGVEVALAVGEEDGSVEGVPLPAPEELISWTHHVAVGNMVE